VIQTQQDAFPITVLAILIVRVEIDQRSVFIEIDVVFPAGTWYLSA
jgi:hypothetical protein